MCLAWYKKALTAILVVAALSPAFVFAADSVVRAEIEAKLKREGVDRTLTQAQFNALVDSLAEKADESGVNVTQIEANTNAETALSQARASSFSVADTPEPSLEMALPGAGLEEVAITISVLIALSLLYGIWRRYRHLRSGNLTSAL